MSTLHLKTLTLTSHRPYTNSNEVLTDWLEGKTFFSTHDRSCFSIHRFKDINKEFNKIEVFALDETFTKPLATVLWEARIK